MLLLVESGPAAVAVAVAVVVVVIAGEVVGTVGIRNVHGALVDIHTVLVVVVVDSRMDKRSDTVGKETGPRDNRTVVGNTD